MTEHAEAAMLMRAVRASEAAHPELRLFMAIPNGGLRNRGTAIKLKAEGVRPGVPDYLLPVARGGFHGLAIELKTATGKTSPDQRAWLAALVAQGWAAEVCRGWEQAWSVLRDYLAEPSEDSDPAIPAAIAHDSPPSRGLELGEPKP